jgi:hypothetical protein
MVVMVVFSHHDGWVSKLIIVRRVGLVMMMMLLLLLARMGNHRYCKTPTAGHDMAFELFILSSPTQDSSSQPLLPKDLPRSLDPRRFARSLHQNTVMQRFMRFRWRHASPHFRLVCVVPSSESVRQNRERESDRESSSDHAYHGLLARCFGYAMLVLLHPYTKYTVEGGKGERRVRSYEVDVGTRGGELFLGGWAGVDRQQRGVC